MEHQVWGAAKSMLCLVESDVHVRLLLTPQTRRICQLIIHTMMLLIQWNNSLIQSSLCWRYFIFNDSFHLSLIISWLTFMLFSVNSWGHYEVLVFEILSKYRIIYKNGAFVKRFMQTTYKAKKLELLQNPVHNYFCITVFQFFWSISSYKPLRNDPSKIFLIFFMIISPVKRIANI